MIPNCCPFRDKSRTEVQADPRVYVNTVRPSVQLYSTSTLEPEFQNAPFSAIVCGVQGSGKSHTVSVLLENMIIPNCKALGPLEKPLAGLVLHFGTGGENCLPCEAAYLARQKYHEVQVPPVRVYVSRSVLNRMRRVYAPLGKNVTVEPLLFTEDELDAQAFLSMMAVESSDSAPLYMQVFLVGEPDPLYRTHNDSRWSRAFSGNWGKTTLMRSSWRSLKHNVKSSQRSSEPIWSNEWPC